ncbi:hypothetical protein LLH06_12940 [Mucilaginibacter daejeonensis]|uniref:hypothetical protein n=1 Tax=Mucilaginibacter daejeonensis TaxID=398049 RepID=UPI001D172E6E|nr:hypothetical protein [Mucilaginibacter daejeonensis]UEG51869.1 hypothetical protein LLH06_12940 [Mucilaginibacter daejeonensis]
MTEKEKKVIIMFIAEAPGSTNNHFYLKNTNLFRAMRAAFEQAFGKFSSADEFLDFFNKSGCLLDHLYPLGKETSAKSMPYAVGQLADRIRLIQPKHVIILMKRIVPDVNKAAIDAGVSPSEILTTAYPAGSERNRQVFIHDISTWLRHILDNF